MGQQGVPAFNVWLEQGGDNRVLQVNKRVIEERKGGGGCSLAGLLLGLLRHELTGASFQSTEGLE